MVSQKPSTIESSASTRNNGIGVILMRDDLERVRDWAKISFELAAKRQLLGINM